MSDIPPAARPDPPPWRAWETPARAGDLDGAIVAFVRDRDWVTFPELMNALDPYFAVHGERAIETLPNAILWLDMSAELVDALLRLRASGRLRWAHTSLLTYAIDGAILRLPIIRRAPRSKERGYARPRWFPTCIRLGPTETAAKAQHGAEVRA